MYVLCFIQILMYFPRENDPQEGVEMYWNATGLILKTLYCNRVHLLVYS